MISVLRSALPSSRFLLSSQKNYNLQPFHNKAWLIHFHVTCATRIMLATLPDIFTYAISNTRKYQLANTFWRPLGAYVI